MQEKINFNEAKDKALEFVTQNGPSIPSQVASQIQIPPLFASALLSQLISEKSVKVSHLKIGGTPLYYIQDHRDKLMNFTNKLPGKEREICEKLQKVGIIIDEQAPLVEKVALRNLKDFSIPLSVTTPIGKKLFWKWYSLSQEEVIKKLPPLLKKYEKPIEKKVEEPKPEVKEKAKEDIKEKTEIKIPETEIKAPILEKQEEKAREIQTKIEVKEGKETEKEIKPIESEIAKTETTTEKIESEETQEKPLSKTQTEFLVKLKDYLSMNKVRVLQEDVNKKERTVELVIEVSSSLGKMNFFAIAKNKKVLSVADLMLAYYRSREKKLPLILLNSGKFAKNAEEKAKEVGITLKSLEDAI